MNPSRQNQLIADACPGRFKFAGYRWQWLDGDQFTDCRRGSIIDDLNAMAVAVQTLDINQLSRYADELDEICVQTHICPLTHWQAVVEAKPHQRADAFGKVMGLW